MPEIIFPYTNVELTEEVNRIPNQFGLINALNIAPREELSSRYVRIDFRDGQIVVLSATEPGNPGQMSEDDGESGIILLVPHFPHLSAIRPEDLAGGVEVINGMMQSRSLDRETAKKLTTIRGHHAITREYIRMGMLKGLIKDGKGKTLYDLYSVFGITKKTVDFALGTATSKPLEKCEEVSDHIIKNAKGETVGQVESIVDTKFFNKFVQHPNVEKYWLGTNNAESLNKMERDRLGGNWGRVFEHGSLMLREYKGSFPVRSSTGTIVTQAAIADNTGHAYPTGTQSMFRTYDAPPHHMDHVNQPPSGDEEVFISTEVLKHGSGVEFKSQSNSLAVCKQPECLVEMTTSN